MNPIFDRILVNPRNPRRGSTLVVVLVALLVVVALAGLLVQSFVARQRQLRRQEQAAQSRWLAESAVERGAAHLKDDPAYKGESWQVSAEELATEKSGIAEIRVELVDGVPDRRRVIVQARFPDDPIHTIATSKQILVDLPPPGEMP